LGEHRVLLLKIQGRAAHGTVVGSFLVLAGVEQPLADQAFFDLGEGRALSLGAPVGLHLASVAGILGRQFFKRRRARLLLCSF
jgi:hypothetical protein